MIFMNRSLLFSAFTSFLVAGVFLSAFPGTAAAADPGPATDSTDENGYSEIATFAKAVELIRQDYVDGQKVSYHDLINAAMKGMLSSLDPHSQFMDPDDFKDMQDDTRSRLNGLGVESRSKTTFSPSSRRWKKRPQRRRVSWRATRS